MGKPWFAVLLGGGIVKRLSPQRVPWVDGPRIFGTLGLGFLAPSEAEGIWFKRCTSSWTP